MERKDIRFADILRLFTDNELTEVASIDHRLRAEFVEQNYMERIKNYYGPDQHPAYWGYVLQYAVQQGITEQRLRIVD